ncbi:MAG: multidrug transporter [Proteobacteria bacterium]|nr:multidrug transporter [Pseudomonadota bacterium]
MTLLISVSIVFGLLALFFLVRMIHCVRRGRIMRAGGACISCCVSAALCGAAVVLLFSFLSYARLVEERVVSRIEFRRISPLEFQARLMIAGEADRFFILRGDEWQMDAKIITWTPPATILGLDPIFQLDRLSGRYSDIDREVSEARTVHSLAPPFAVDLWSTARRFPLLAPGVDAYYGTATFVPMADGARYEVSLSRDALLARPVNDRAKAAIGSWDHGH